MASEAHLVLAALGMTDVKSQISDLPFAIPKGMPTVIGFAGRAGLKKCQIRVNSRIRDPEFG